MDDQQQCSRKTTKLAASIEPSIIKTDERRCKERQTKIGENKTESIGTDSIWLKSNSPSISLSLNVTELIGSTSCYEYLKWVCQKIRWILKSSRMYVMQNPCKINEFTKCATFHRQHNRTIWCNRSHKYKHKHRTTHQTPNEPNQSYRLNTFTPNINI